MRSLPGSSPTGRRRRPRSTTSAGSQEVFFTRPTIVPIYVVVNLTKDAATWPADGAAQVKAALVAFAVAHLGIGDDVVSSRLAAEVFAISGVVDVTVLHIGTAPAPSTGVTVAIGDHELAALATARITVNVS
jgi:uncharacterized phage protein gp47/JayE